MESQAVFQAKTKANFFLLNKVPEDEGEGEEGEGHVAVGDLADGRAVQDVVGHHLLHRHSHARQVTGQP